MKLRLPPVYPITDVSTSGLSIPEQVKRMVAGGAQLVQLREKTASARDFYEAASESLNISRAEKVRVIVNDRVDIALSLRTDGVHLGQRDLSPAQARLLLGDGAIIGYSTHTIEQAVDALKLPIDYLAFGPVFPTATKEDPDPVVGLERLSEVKSLAGDLPVVAIGGITLENIGSVWDAGADSAAVIAGLLSDPDLIGSKLRNFLALFNDRQFQRG